MLWRIAVGRQRSRRGTAWIAIAPLRVRRTTARWGRAMAAWWIMARRNGGFFFFFFFFLARCAGDITRIAHAALRMFYCAHYRTFHALQRTHFARTGVVVAASLVG